MKGKTSLQCDLLLIPVVDSIHNSQFIPSNSRIVNPTEYFSFSVNVEGMGTEAVKVLCHSPSSLSAFKRKHHGLFLKL